jgi:glycosyltransferase involved in cell wall biosynthesis
MLPKITIVTPSFNQGNYLEKTILSVIGQGYPNLEYIIMDGGSTDESLNIIRKYEGHFAHWESGPDKGQADAINKGFQIATGDILAWLNSDDMYLPGTLNYISKRLENTQEIRIVFGNCLRFNQETRYASGSNVEEAHRTLDISLIDYIIQPSCFWTKTVWDKVGSLNSNLVYCLDWDWFIRAKRLEVEFEAVGEYLSLYRLHAQHKTALGGEKRINEIAWVYQTYHSIAIAQNYLAFSKDPAVQISWKVMHKIRFPWINKVMRSFFFRNLTEQQCYCITLMAT